MDKIKVFLAGLRDAIAYSFSWLVICVIIASLLSGNDIITVRFLIKLFVLCFWGAVCFTVCFRNQGIQRKGFMFALTLFYVLFIPAEILMFYVMGIFQKTGNIALWGMFIAIVVVMYIVSAIIDKVIMYKRSEEYTNKLLEYKTSNE